jgi:flagellar M-ring protein FliF
MLTLKNGMTLSNQEAQSMADHIKASIQGITYENISITDHNLKHYSIGEEVVDEGSELNSRVELQTRLTEQTKIAGEQLLIPVFGINNVQVSPTIRLNFDKVVTESVKFDPPVAGELDGIVRSSSDLFEAQKKEDTAEGVPGTDSNAMGTVEYPYDSLDNNKMYEKALTEKNYEINETRTTIEQEQGKIAFISVAVAINANSVQDDYTAEVRNLVSAGLGISQDDVSVEFVPFFVDTAAEQELKKQEEYEARERQKDLIERIIKWAVILLLGLALMMLIRMIVRSVKPPPEPQPVLAEGGMNINYSVDDDDDDDIVTEPDIIDVTAQADIELQKKSAGLEQIEKFIDKDPAAVAQLLRNWLTDE